jgi:hypothetical protein
MRGSRGGVFSVGWREGLEVRAYTYPAEDDHEWPPDIVSFVETIRGPDDAFETLCCCAFAGHYGRNSASIQTGRKWFTVY